MENHKELKSVAKFISDFSTCMMAVGAQTSRIERNALRIAKAYHLKAEMLFFQKTMVMTLWDSRNEHSYSMVSRIKPMPLNFEINARLSHLSWRIHDEHIPLNRASKLCQRILDRPRVNPWIVLWLVSFANASFCRLFHGDFISMAIVFVATFIGFFFKQQMQKWHWNEFAVFILSAMFASAFGSLGYLCNWGTTPDMALGTSVLYLIPGVPLINGVMDIIDGHIVTGCCRLFKAALLVSCIAIGLSAILFITGLVTI